jgi:hypothetical protein
MLARIRDDGSRASSRNCWNLDAGGRVWEGILALPLIGTPDSAHPTSWKARCSVSSPRGGIAIIDITGVPTVDTSSRAAPDQDHLGGTADGRRLYPQRYPPLHRADDVPWASN